MKKIMATCLAMVTAATMSISAFASAGGFVSSPSQNPAPTLESFTASSEDFTGQLVVSAYSERDDMPEDLRASFETAYNQIVECDDLTTLNADLAQLAEEMGIAGTDLAVSDLFDIHVEGDLDTDVGFEITLGAETLDRFVGLLHMVDDGVWELVSDAEVVNNEQLRFSVDSLSPFAIVVDTNDGTAVEPGDDSSSQPVDDSSTPDSVVDDGGVPDTGENTMIYVYAGAMVVLGAAIVFIAVKSRKQKVK